VPLSIAGHVVDDPMPIWRKYARDHGRTIREYDLAEPGDANALTPGEAWISRVIGSCLRHDERDQLVGRAAAAPWMCIHAGADLADADPAVPGGLFADAARLYWWFTWPERIHGVRVAKVHKVLHFKRRGIYPILDDHLRALYEGFASAWIEPLSYLGDLTSADSPPFWAAYREDLLGNHDELDRYRKLLLAKDEDDTVKLAGKLTRLRLQDIIAWRIDHPAPGDDRQPPSAR